jgi:hypothetical protein
MEGKLFTRARGLVVLCVKLAFPELEQCVPTEPSIYDPVMNVVKSGGKSVWGLYSVRLHIDEKSSYITTINGTQLKASDLTFHALGLLSRTIMEDNGTIRRVDAAIEKYSPLLNYVKIACESAELVAAPLTIDGKNYPRLELFPEINRDNCAHVIAELAATTSGKSRDGLTTMVCGFMERYYTAFDRKDLLSSALTGVSRPSVMPAGFTDVANGAFRMLFEKKYGGAWKIPGFGPECEKVCRGVVSTPGSFIGDKFYNEIRQ